MPPLRVFLVDDSPDFIKSAEYFISRHPTLELVGKATSGLDALAQVPQIKPDLILMDWSMPGMSGPDATRVLKSKPDSPRVFMLTMYDIPSYRTAAALAGADGFLAKAEWTTTLFPLVHQIFNLDDQQGLVQK